MNGGDDSELERLTALLGHEFGEPDLLTEALTHSSAAVSTGHATYERMEFLGDRVLGLIVAERLFNRYPGEPEGDLARRHAVLVSRQTLVGIALEIGLADSIRMPAGEAAAGTNRRPAIMADACEALIGALYLDAGLDAARIFIDRYWGSLIEETPPGEPKTVLQEWVQGRGKALPHYRTVETKGPPHEPVFTIEVGVDGYPPARATGRSKRVAEQEAARRMLAAIGAAGDLEDDVDSPDSPHNPDNPDGVDSA